MSVNYRKISTYYLVGNLFNTGMSFITVPVFTRILSTTDYGIVTTYNSWISILTMTMSFALHMGIRAAFIDYREEIDDVMSVTTTFTLVSGAFFCFILGFGSLFLDINIAITLVVLCLLQGLASAIMQNYSMYLMMLYRYKFRTAIMILPNLLSVIVSVIAMLFVVKTHLYMGRIIPTAFITMGFGILTVVLIYRKSHVLYNKEYLKYTLGVSVPLVFHGIALNILSQSDRTMITWLAGASQTGIYSLVYNFGSLATVLTATLEGVWTPWFIGKMKMRDIDSINIFVKDYINVITYAVVVLVFLTPELIRILVDSKYWEGIIIIPPIVLSNYIIFVYSLYVNIEHFYKKTSYITVNTIIAAGTNIVLNYVFIPKFGYIAAAYTTLFSYLVAFMLHARYAKKLEPNVYPLNFFVRPMTHVLVATVAFYRLVNFGLLRWILIFIYIILISVSERKRLALLFPKISTKLRK